MKVNDTVENAGTVELKEEIQFLEQIAERTAIQVRRDRVRSKVRLDLVTMDGDEVLARVYLSDDRARKLVGAIGRAVLGG